MTKPNFATAPHFQFLAGRVLAGIGRSELAERSGLELEALQLFEAGDGDLSERERRRLGEALFDAGVLFKAATQYAGIGVRLRFVVAELDMRTGGSRRSRLRRVRRTA